MWCFTKYVSRLSAFFEGGNTVRRELGGGLFNAGEHSSKSRKRGSIGFVGSPELLASQGVRTKGQSGAGFQQWEKKFRNITGRGDSRGQTICFYKPNRTSGGPGVSLIGGDMV